MWPNYYTLGFLTSLWKSARPARKEGCCPQPCCLQRFGWNGGESLLVCCWSLALLGVAESSQSRVAFSVSLRLPHSVSFKDSCHWIKATQIIQDHLLWRPSTELHSEETLFQSYALLFQALGWYLQRPSAQNTAWCAQQWNLSRRQGEVPQTTARSQLPKAAALTPRRVWPPTQTRRPSPRRCRGCPGGARESSCPSLTSLCPALPEKHRSWPQSWPRCPPNPEAPGGRGLLCSSGAIGTTLTGSGQEHPLPTQATPAPGGECPPSLTNIRAAGGLSPDEENLDSGHTPPDLQHLPTRVSCSWNKSRTEPNLTPAPGAGVLLTFWESRRWMSPNVPAHCQGPWGN